MLMEDLMEAAAVYATVILGSAVIAIFWHRWVKPFIWASIGAALTVEMISIIEDTVQHGYFDGWWIIAFWTLGLLAFVVAVAMGILLDFLGLSARRKRTLR